MVATSFPKTFTPTWVRIPVESISIRLRIGWVQMLVTPGRCSFSSSLCRMVSLVVPAGHLSLGFKLMTVSVMFTGAGSMALSARPILPTTLSTSGSCAMMLSCQRRISVALVREMLGSVMGMNRAVSSSSGGMNSEPMVVASHSAEAKMTTVALSVMIRCFKAQSSTGL